MPSVIKLDSIPRRAAELCRTPAGLLAFIDERGELLVFHLGMPEPHRTNGTCFCAQAVCGNDLYVVQDASTDPLFRSERLVREAGFRFYAGIPLISPSGFPLGTLAVLDREPRELSASEETALRMLAAQALLQIELERQTRTIAALKQERKALSDAAEERGRHLDIAQRLSRMGSWEVGLRDERLRCSDEIYRIFGIERGPDDDVNTFMQLVHAEDRRQVILAHERALKDGVPLDVEFRVLRPDGEERFVHMRAEMAGRPDGAPSLSGTTQDITAKRNAAGHLHLLETSVAHLNDMVMISEAGQDDDTEPRIVFVNKAFERHTGYRREEVIGMSPRMFHGPKTDPAELERLHVAMKRKEPVFAELVCYTKSGEEFWAEADVVPVAAHRCGLTHFVAVLRNITERKQRDLKLVKTTRALQILKRCNEALMRAQDQRELMRQVCELAVESDGYQFAWVGLVRDDGKLTVRPVASAGDLRDSERAVVTEIDLTTGSTAQAPLLRVVRDGAPVLIEDMWIDPAAADWREWATSEGFRSVIMLPMITRGSVFGVLALYDRNVRSFSDDEVRLMQDLANDVAFGVEHLRAQRHQRRLEAAIVKVATSVSAATGNAFFEQLTRNMTEAVGAQAGFIARISECEPLACRTIVAVIDGRVVDNFEYVIKGTPCEHLLTDSNCVVVDKVAERFPASPTLMQLGARAYVGSRLVDASGQLLGLLYVLFRSPLKHVDLVNSTFRIFAARAASELERQDADARIRDQASLLDKAQDAIMVCDTAHRIAFWNKSAERLYGWSASEALGKMKTELLHEDAESFRGPLEAVMRHGEWSGELQHRRKDGSLIVVEAHWTRITGDDGRVKSILAIHTDITMRKAAEEKVQQLAFYDQLTRLPNRSSLMERLQRALALSARHRRYGGLMLIDLDNFKTLNDTLGHDKGDMLLQQVAARLTPCVRATDTVARLGGDEFVVLLEDLSRNSGEAAVEAEIAAEKILGALNQPYRLQAYEHISTPSIGVTLFRDGDTLDDVLKRADLAMYQAKGAGRNTIRFFDPDMQAAVRHRLGLESDLRNAARRNEFVLYYQAQVDRDGVQTGAEALIRWEQPSRGIVSPAEFIPLAEETGIILRLGEWVLETACQLLADWARDPATAHMTMSVNVSARQFRHPDFVPQVFDVLDRTGANPAKLKLELTESLLVEDIEATIGKMSALKDRGVGFSLDDFGTGYSSLSYLKRFPLDQLKIDQSFVRDVLVDPNDAAIARTIVGLGQSLGLSVIAEGVETEAQREFLAAEGCHGYQGFLFSHPAPAPDFLSSLRSPNVLLH